MYSINVGFWKYLSMKELLKDYFDFIKNGIDGNWIIYKLIWKLEVDFYKDVILYLFKIYVIDLNYVKKLNSIIKYY